MHNHQRLDRLFRQARRESPPRVDVAARVMAALRRREFPAPAEPHPLAWIAAAASIAATTVGLLAWISWQASLDPVAEVLYLAGGLL